MQGIGTREDAIVVEFTRIGPNLAVPNLVVPADLLAHVRDHIHEYVAAHLNVGFFAIQLSGDQGFIDLTTHSAGSFTIRRLQAQTGQPAQNNGSVLPESRK